MIPRLAQNEQLQRIPWVNGSVSNENWIAPQWQLPLYDCMANFISPPVSNCRYNTTKTIAMLTPFHPFVVSLSNHGRMKHYFQFSRSTVL
ncbi:hypothetical protein GALL_44690 [mine drainage metagenome]|uniref:Uncharacterized protein n=1 Tax=mine drainage metagenome TaxID=410659 RepID=A0A1J5T1I4_9ZZZZ